MEIVEKTTQLLNSRQIFVDESDQPVYRLLKEIQWRFSNRFGPEKYFRLLESKINPSSLWFTNRGKRLWHFVDYPLLEQTLWCQ